MDITEPLRVSLIALMEDALGAGLTTSRWKLELTTISSPASPYTQSTTQSYKLESLNHVDLYSILQSLRASSARISSNTQE